MDHDKSAVCTSEYINEWKQEYYCCHRFKQAMHHPELLVSVALL